MSIIQTASAVFLANMMTVAVIYSFIKFTKVQKPEDLSFSDAFYFLAPLAIAGATFYLA